MVFGTIKQRKFASILPLGVAVAISLHLLIATSSLGARLPMRDYTTDEGLVNNEIITVFQDSRGYLWFGTYGGLSRFDGKRFTNYEDTNSTIASSVVRAITEDRNNNIWIGLTGGIAKLQKETSTDTFIIYSDKDGLLGRDIVGLEADPDGGLWILTEQGINYFKNNTFISKRLEGIDSSLSGTSLQVSPEGIYVIAQKRLVKVTQGQRELAVQTCPIKNIEIQSIRYNPKGKKLYLISTDTLYSYQKEQLSLVAASPLDDDLLNMTVGNENTVWIISETMLWHINEQGDTVYSNEMLNHKSLSNLLEDREGNLWLATWSGATMVVDTAILNYQDFPIHIVSAIVKDSSNNLFLGGDKGIVKLSPEGEVLFFKKSAFVEFLFYDNGKIFTGTDSGGLNILDQQGKLLATYDPDTIFTCMIKDSKGKFWLGSYSGLYSFSDNKVYPEIDTQGGLGSNVVWTLLEDEQKRLWVGTENGLSCLKNTNWSHFTTEHGLPHASIWYLYGDASRGSLAATSRGIVRLKDEGFEHLPQLQNQPIDNLATDISGKLWVGAAKGIYRVNENGKIDLTLNKAKGLPTNSTYFRTALTDHHFLYIGTHKGLSRIDINKKDRGGSKPSLYIDKIHINKKSQETLTSHFSTHEKNITFFFHAVHMYLPEKVTYSFFLEGMDQTWGEPSDINQAVYTNLSPGKYTFKVRAIDGNGINSSVQSISFSIEKPFWLTGWFLTLEILTGCILVITLSYLVGERKVKNQEAYAKRLENIVEERTQTLKKARKDAEAANQAKSIFLAGMSHEIRTPLNSVVGITELLLNSQLTHEQRDFTKTLQKSAEALLKIIDDILDFSRIEAGVIELETELFDLMATVEDLGQLLATRADEKNIDLIIRYAPNTPKYFQGDSNRIRQILLNLAGNAIKFTEHGYVLIDVHLHQITDDEVTIHFRVEDSGIGIPEKYLESIFNRFTQTDNGAGRKYGGTGLGLAISSQLVALMGGRIQVESNLGKGSVFDFMLSFPRMQQQSRVDSLVDDFSKLRVITVDDNSCCREMVMERLGAWHIHCEQAKSGEEALEKLARAEKDGTPFNVALIDHQMPTLSGTDLARAIKKESFQQSIVLVLLTVISRPIDKKLFDTFGIDATLYKPVHTRQLFSLLKTISTAVLKEQTPILPLVDLPIYKPSDKLRFNADILLVEDLATNRKVATAMLNSFGCKVDIVENGEEAIVRAADKGYDLILMDCHLPGIDGYETTHLIRKNELGMTAQAGGNFKPHVPIVALTASASTRDREQCLAAGMDDYLSKPISRSDLLCLLKKILPPSKGNFGDLIDRVLIAGKNTTDSNIITQTVHSLFPDAVTRYASGGIETCTLIASFLPNLIFLDDDIEQTDVFTLLNYLSTHDIYKTIHTVIVTNHTADKAYIVKLQRAGGRTVLTRPLTGSTIAEEVQKEYYNSGESPKLFSSASVDTEANTTTISTVNSDISDDNTILQADRLLQTFKGDLDMIKDYIGIFINDIPEVMQDLETDIQEVKMDMVEHQAHKVKNMAAETGGLRLYQLASAMENAAVAGNHSQCVNQLPMLKKELGLLINAIREQGW